MKALLFCVWAFVGLCISSVSLGAGLLVLGVEALTLWHIAPPRRREAILAALRSGPLVLCLVGLPLLLLVMSGGIAALVVGMLWLVALQVWASDPRASRRSRSRA